MAESCKQCGELVRFLQDERGVWVCLEVKPWPGDGRPRLYSVVDTVRGELAVPWHNRPGVEVYACHTSRPNHDHFRRR